jgi:hypothetical protein
VQGDYIGPQGDYIDARVTTPSGHMLMTHPGRWILGGDLDEWRLVTDVKTVSSVGRKEIENIDSLFLSISRFQFLQP